MRAMINKTIVQRLCALLMVFSLAIGQCYVVFADEGGGPSLTVGGDGVYEVEPGKDNRITIQIKNKGTGVADNVSVDAKISGTDPLRVKMQGGGNTGSIGQNGYKDLTMTVTFDGEVDEASYAVTLNYTYSNKSGTNTYTGTDTIYLKVKGFSGETQSTFEGMALTPATLNPGSSANLTGKIVNTGSKDMYDVEISLTNLASDKISLSGGFSSKTVAKIISGQSTTFDFPLVASADMAAGNYPVTLNLKYKDAYNKEIEKTQDYYVNVGGIAGQKALLEIRNMSEPQGVYDVNQNFTVTFDLHNNGLVAAKDVIVTAEALDTSAVVPKSSSVKTISSLQPGSSTGLSFTFASTAASKTQNYPIQFTVEYTSGGTAVTTLKQFAGANVTNPDDDENESKPKIIVSNYVCDPIIVMAGQEFDLNMTLLNTHREKGVKNIKMFLTLAEETSSEDEKSGNIFTPVNSSNTFYFDAIPSKGTVEKALRLYVVPGAQPKTYTLTVNFEYEDNTGKEYTAQELLGINVEQVTEMQVDEFAVPEMIEMYSPVTISFGYYNTGKVTLNNVMIKVEGEVDCDYRSTYIGNMDPGDSDYFETSFSPNTPGEVPVAIVISYENAAGEAQEIRRELSLNVMEPMMPEEGEMEPENPPMDMKKAGITALLLVILAAGLLIFIKKQKGESSDTFAESIGDDDDDDDDDDDKEGMSI